MENPIRKIRTNMNLSQAEFARRVGLTRQYISRLEQGHYAQVSVDVTSWIVSEAGIIPVHVNFAYHDWQSHKRRTWAETHNVEKLKPPLTGAYYKAFKEWRKTYWSSVEKFCTDLCVNAALVTVYE